MFTKGLIFALAVLLSGLMADTARAASAAYCALFAREYAVDTVQPRAAPGMLESVQDQAYHRCLKQDDPPAPNAAAFVSTNIASTTSRIGPSSSAIDVATADPASAGPVVTSAPTLKPSVVPTQPRATTVSANASKPAAVYKGSGLPAWTPQWKAWCAKNFPNSWDPKTGMVVPGSSGKRELCR